MTIDTKLKFKPITSGQATLFPANLDDRISSNHPVRLVNEIVDKLNIDAILSSYKSGGSSSYHPRMMIKVLFYSYLNNTYSCRKIASQLRENINYMWLSGNNMPNFRTINDFRGKKLQDTIHGLFAQLVEMLCDMGYVSLETQYIDGTKIESASNRYTFVWRKSVEKYKQKVEEKVVTVIREIDRTIMDDNNNLNQDEKYHPIDSKSLDEKIKEINQNSSKLDKDQKKEIKKLEEDSLPRLKKYEKQLEILEDRNSYSKTDTDATFMRMKEDHMKNGQLKPAYNVQISTEKQFITNYSLHRRPGDPATLIPHLDLFKKMYTKQSPVIVADSGYGSEQNYMHCEQHNLEAFIKYNYFHKEQKKKYINDPFLPANLFYNDKENFLICPIGQRMNMVGTKKGETELGYKFLTSTYEAKNCKGCPLRGKCHKAKGNRRIDLNHNLKRLRNKAKEKLTSVQGLYHRSMRPIEPEAVFGHIKFNNKFNRFTMKGIKKVSLEFALVAISHNLRKYYTQEVLVN